MITIDKMNDAARREPSFRKAYMDVDVDVDVDGLTYQGCPLHYQGGEGNPVWMEP